jgi:apolipoprotein N-acyltransferase
VHVRQLADLTGVYGVSGVVAFVNAALAELLGRSTRAALRPVATAAALLVFVVGYGALRIHQLVEPPGAAVLDVALVQGNLRSELRWKRTHASRVLRLYGRLTREAILAQDERPDLVIWPENALQTAVDDPSYGPPLMALARSVPLLIGAPRHTRDESGRREYNSAHFIHPGGHVASYDKRRLLPFSESRPLGSWASFGSRGDLDRGDWSAGRQPGVFALDGHGLGVLICMDALYPELAREAVEEGADVLVNISNDGWFVGPGALEQHFAHVVFRAIETRRPLLRIAPTGVTAVVSPAGDVVARLESDTRGTLRVQVHVPSSPPSLYAQIGDAFSIACLLVCSMPLVQRGHAALPPHIGDGSHSVRSPRRIA